MILGWLCLLGNLDELIQHCLVALRESLPNEAELTDKVTTIMSHYTCNNTENNDVDLSYSTIICIVEYGVICTMRNVVEYSILVGVVVLLVRPFVSLFVMH